MPPFHNKTFFSCDTFFTLLCFANNTLGLLLEILGGHMHGPSPPQIWGDRPPVPPNSPPMVVNLNMPYMAMFSKTGLILSQKRNSVASHRAILLTDIHDN